MSIDNLEIRTEPTPYLNEPNNPDKHQSAFEKADKVEKEKKEK